MPKKKCFEIAIHLETMHDLFAQPVEDPFSEKAHFVSGIEMIKSELRFASLGQEARATIFLPKESIEADSRRKITGAIQRYCQFKVRQNEDTMAAFRRDAFTSLLVGIVFLAGGLLLSQFLQQMTLLPPLLTTFLSDGFTIAFWVILWRPVDFFLFELWPFWRENRIYKTMIQMEVSVSAERQTSISQMGDVVTGDYRVS
jgi:hypothetical protein